MQAVTRLFHSLSRQNTRNRDQDQKEHRARHGIGRGAFAVPTRTGSIYPPDRCRDPESSSPPRHRLLLDRFVMRCLLSLPPPALRASRSATPNIAFASDRSSRAPSHAARSVCLSLVLAARAARTKASQDPVAPLNSSRETHTQCSRRRPRNWLACRS